MKEKFEKLKRFKIVRRLYAAGKAFKKAAYTPKNEKENVEIPFVADTAVKVTTANPVTVKDLKWEYCTGCGACYNLCPVNAITMQYDKEGFLSPVVDEDKCTKCGLCIKACPSNNPEYINTSAPECYASIAKDEEVRMKSSSGAIFSLVSSYVLEMGGFVCGAAYDDKFVLKHMLVDSEDGMQKLRESKYVQSDTGTVYKEIGTILKSDKPVLFCGCGCQVAGLNAYLKVKKINADKLYTIDLMCHGSPSPKLFEKYINEYHGGPENIESLSFRSKEYFGWSTEMNVKYKDGSVFRQTRIIDPYYKAFLPCISVRKACGHCTYAKVPRQGDLTLADFWGVHKYNPHYDDGKGTSIVVVNNDKGKKLMDMIQSKLKLHKRVETDYILTHGQPFNHSFKTHPAHDLYFKYISLGASMEKAYDYATKRKFDVAIMGVWPGCNYGSVATYYALHQLITSFGLTVLMIDKPIITDNDAEQGMTHSRRFAEEHYEISRKYKLNELKVLNQHVDTFIMGCDQVWNRGISKHFGMSYYFNFVEDSKKKLSYAASFGHSRDFCNANDRTSISAYLKRFDAISVREADGVRICDETYGVEATQVLDPVFVCDKEEFVALTEKSSANQRPDKGEKFIATYILDPSHEKKEAIKWIQSKLGIKVINVLDGLPWTFEGNRAKMEGMGEIPENVQVEDWLYYIKNCEYLITDSCHGISFGLIFERPFAGIANPHRGLSRFESLLGLFELKHRFVTDAKDIVGNDEFLKPIDYDAVGEIMQRERARSRQWLKDALFAPKKVNPHCVYATVDERLKDN
ncbi:MAG: Coenzyme F420 hydrogenase/dehydrogenase, beta subunit C-terminal domain [Ruminiclostridium sp.]|nr:Coenzyme F420 hydrogenase/dehydrogenase, beta subunit C-terminal domain [Ruminiclostridium sp.]